LKFFIIFWYFFGTNDSATLRKGMGLETNTESRHG